ncbi:MAG: site-2 protease family protein [Adlercreutzia equolifaciens]
MNLLFAMLVFIIVFSIIGFQVQHPETGEITTIHASVLQALQAGFMYIGMVIQAVAGLFNPATAAQTVSDSTSIVGIAVMSKDYFQAGLVEALEFMAMISVSLGIMNLLPIPPLDGGRFVVEIFQKGTRKTVSQKAMNYMSLAGMALFLGFFVIMLNQDIQRFVFGNWG